MTEVRVSDMQEKGFEVLAECTDVHALKTVLHGRSFEVTITRVVNGELHQGERIAGSLESVKECLDDLIHRDSSAKETQDQ